MAMSSDGAQSESDSGNCSMSSSGIHSGLYTVGILTVSDSCFHRKKNDISGMQMYALVSKTSVFPVPAVHAYRKIVPDEKSSIKEALTEWAEQLNLDLILTIGGTGFSPRDVTPEATEEVCERKAPSLAQAITTLCFETTPFAVLSRATCGIYKRTIILNLPGSAKGSKECFMKVAGVLPHAIDQLRGDLKAVEMSHCDIQGHVHVDVTDHKSKVDTLKVALRARTSPYPMVSSDEALKIILSHCATKGTETKKNNDCVGYVSAEDIKAEVPSPPFRASIKDGYAVFAEEGTGSRKVLGVLTAGDNPDDSALEPGGCIRVSTGAPVPLNADAVIQVEDTSVSKMTEEGDQELEIMISKKPEPSVEIREIGSDIAKGEVVIPKGKVITSFDCGILAAAGVEDVTVHSLPCVAVLSTGDELVKSCESLKPGCIIDSNKPVLCMMLKEMNFPYFDAGIAKDNPDDIKKKLEMSFASSDVTVVTGGVSMGEKDYLKEVLVTDFLADIHFGRIHMKPGKPTTFGTVMYYGKKKLIFCLPGNPVSAVVTFHLYVVPCLRKIMGHQNLMQLTIKAKLAEDVVLDPRPEFHRAILIWDKELGPVAHSTGSQLSSRLLSLTHANALMVLPPKTNDLAKLHKLCEIPVMLLNYFASQG